MQETLRNRLQDYPNKSKIVNQALELYFHKQAYMKQAEEQWLHDMARDGLESIKSEESYTLNPDAQAVSESQISDFLLTIAAS